MVEPKDRSEIQIQTLFRARVGIQCPGVHVVAVPNAAKRSQWAAQRAKREGMATGFPDLMAIASGKIAFIEVKAAKGRLSIHQEEWLDRLQRMGFPATVIRDPDEGLEFLRANGFPFLVGRMVA